MNLECNHVVQTMSEILKVSKYEDIELEVLQDYTLRLKFPKIDSTMTIDQARDIASKLNWALGLKDKQKFKFVNINHAEKCAYIHLVNNGKSQNTKTHC